MAVVVPYNQDSYPRVNSHNDGKLRFLYFIFFGTVLVNHFNPLRPSTGGNHRQTFLLDRHRPRGVSPTARLVAVVILLDMCSMYLHVRHTVSGWWYTYPSEKYESQLG